MIICICLKRCGMRLETRPAVKLNQNVDVITAIWFKERCKVPSKPKDVRSELYVDTLPCARMKYEHIKVIKNHSVNGRGLPSSLGMMS